MITESINALRALDPEVGDAVLSELCRARRGLELIASENVVSDAVLLGFTGRYLALELAEGTPFTENGANTLRRRGSIKIEINS